MNNIASFLFFVFYLTASRFKMIKYYRLINNRWNHFKIINYRYSINNRRELKNDDVFEISIKSK